MLFLEDLEELCVDLLCLLRELHITVVHEDEVLILVTRGRRHLEHTAYALVLN